jgi:hypothetical protein
MEVRFLFLSPFLSVCLYLLLLSLALWLAPLSLLRCSPSQSSRRVFVCFFHAARVAYLVLLLLTLPVFLLAAVWSLPAHVRSLVAPHIACLVAGCLALLLLTLHFFPLDVEFSFHSFCSLGVAAHAACLGWLLLTLHVLSCCLVAVRPLPAIFAVLLILTLLVFSLVAPHHLS